MSANDGRTCGTCLAAIGGSVMVYIAGILVVCRLCRMDTKEFKQGQRTHPAMNAFTFVLKPVLEHAPDEMATG